jgi:hypothetical protein
MIYRVYEVLPDGSRRDMGDWKSEVAARRHIETMLEEEGPHGESDYEYDRISEKRRVPAVSKIDSLSTLELCRYLRHIGREDHNTLIFKAERALNRALMPSSSSDPFNAAHRLRTLEDEGRDILRAAVIVGDDDI